MPDGEASVTAEVLADCGGQPCVAASPMVEPLLSLSEVNDQVEPVFDRQYAGKDPRKIARKYQLKLCKKALEENIIVYLGTGCGKTHVAVLLMHEMSHLIRKPQKDICIFLAPTVALVQQQAKVVEDSTDFKVGVYCGSSKRLKSHYDWEKEIGQYEVLVMTPQILFHNLSHCFITMDIIALLIFDECHHAQVKSNHPYAEIMKVFYKPDSTKLPRIFGMTASPVVGKGASSEANLAKSINSLEHMLNSKVYSVEGKEELDAFVASPVVKIYNYGPIPDDTISLYRTYYTRLGEIKQQSIATLKTKRNAEEHQKQMNTKKLLNRMHDNVVFCLDNLGIWGALQASRILLSGGHSERNELVEAEEDSTDDSLCDKYLMQAAELFSSECPKSDNGILDISSVEILKEPFFSRKLLRLIGILSSFRVQSNMKCIIFVNRIVTARSLSYILQKLKFLSLWKSDFLVGVHSGLKSMSRKSMNIIVDKFRTGELNLLVATKVGEEGLDIQTCCLVIRFDLPETVASFIQSRGRARMPQSEYAFLVDSGNKKDLELIENFKKDEDRMNMEISHRTSDETFIIPEEKIFKVDSSGASVTSGYSISLLHQYCSKLPHDEYFDPKPQFFFFDDLGGTICNITLPSNAPVHRICGMPQISTEAAKKDACLKAIAELHKLGALSDYLLPKHDDAEEQLSVSSDSDECEDDGSRGELHEMLVPSTFRQAWRNKEKVVHLNSYYIKFSASPEDRIYKKFGLFIMAHLPLEAEKMEIDLHLARGRSVKTNLVPFGVEEFHEDEIKMAQKFQQMFLKVILDRSEFIPDFVPLGKDDVLETSIQPFYLLLPVILQGYKTAMRIDWKVVRRCLSSPIFRNPADARDLETFPSDIHLQLANGSSSVRDVENSLVYAQHKDLFYFVTKVIHEKNGFSPYKDSGMLSYVEHFIKKFSIHLRYPKQPLLHAKPLFKLHNLLHNRKHEDTEPHELEEYFIDLPPELCQLKIIGFSKDIGSSLSLLPSIMHRLGNLLVAVELKSMLLSSFPEAAEVSASRVLEALTTERCQECFSLERLEVLGDSFLKFAVARRLFLMHESLDEGDLTRRRSNVVNNANLFKLATRRNLQVYIRDQAFDPSQFYAIGRPCQRICTKETEESIHSSLKTVEGRGYASQVCCSKNHHWLHKKTIADVVEALVGAFLVESGFKAATAFLTWIGIKVDFEASQVINVCKESTIYFPLSAYGDLPSLEGKLGYSFRHKGLLLQAFVHPSYNKHGGGCYQRLEFLGDAVLDYLITSYLYSAYPKLKPGPLTTMRSVSVNNKAFAYVAVDRSFDKFLLCDSSSLSEAIEKYADHIGSQRPVSEEPKYPKALGDVVESCVGAILIDSGFDLNCVWEIMTSFLDPIMKFSCKFSCFQLSPNKDLQELCQSHNLELKVVETKTTRMFSVEGTVTGKHLCESASANNLNKKEGVRITSQLLLSKLKALGLTSKSKSLEEVLKSSSKGEAKLIGYDETPVDVTAANSIGQIMVKETPTRNSDPEIRLLREAINICSPSTIAVSERFKVNDSDSHSEGTDFPYKGRAKSRLYEFCAANYWKPPSFECCKEEGPSHSKLFTYKVNLEIEDADTILECIGKPHLKKKIAAEDAAEGACWFLQQRGYNINPKQLV